MHKNGRYNNSRNESNFGRKKALLSVLVIQIVRLQQAVKTVTPDQSDLQY